MFNVHEFFSRELKQKNRLKIVFYKKENTFIKMTSYFYSLNVHNSAYHFFMMDLDFRLIMALLWLHCLRKVIAVVGY